MEKENEILLGLAEKSTKFDKQLEIVEAQFNGPTNHLLATITLWHPNKVDLDMCEKVSEKLNELLDKQDPFDFHYTLEVQSLSLTRKLKTKEDFRRAAGEKLRIKLKDKEKADELGTCAEWDDEGVTLQKPKSNKKIAYQEIKHGLIEF